MAQFQHQNKQGASSIIRLDVQYYIFVYFLVTYVVFRGVSLVSADVDISLVFAL